MSGDWGELGIPNLTRISPVKSYRKLQNARLTAFSVSELFLGKANGGIGLKLL